MRMNGIGSVAVVRYPVLLVTFETVAVAPRSRSFGWNLDQEGREIDFCPEAARIEIETRMVDDLARQYEQHLIAAE